MKIALIGLAGGPDAPELDSRYGPVPALAEALAVQGHQVRLYTRRGCGPSGGTYDTVELPAGPATPLTEPATVAHTGEFASRLAAELRSDRPDVVHSHGWLSGLATQLARPAAPVAHAAHGGGDSGDSTDRGQAERAVARHADRLLVVSGTRREELVRAGVPRSRIRVVPCGVLEPADLPELPAPRRGQPRIAVTGGPDHLVPALSALVAVPRADVVVTPTAASERQLRRLRELVDALELAGRVTVAAPSGPADQADRLRGADLAVCLPSPGASNADHLTAMSLGVPVVACGDEIAEAVVDGVTGRHAVGVPPRALARTLRGLLDDATSRQAMGIAARDRARSRYGWTRIGTETTRVYQELVDAPAFAGS